MKKSIIAILLLLAVTLSGCSSSGGVADSGDTAANGASGSATGTNEAAQGAAEAGEQQENGEDAQAGEKAEDKSGAGGEMRSLPADASVEDMVRAFEADYNQAAQSLGLENAYSGLEYEDNDSTATIELESGPMLLIDPPSTYYRVWYAGYPESEEWMLREMQIVLFAADNAFNADSARDYAEEIWQEAWDNKDNMPSAITSYTPSGLTVSMSLNDRGLVSFWVSFD